ncbi:IPT/TIG domain-containing protein, partial [uncultured Wocania sp.]|uniref:IPT/TIG domain-containing protein n=1 Tax=uncultured Wocania sp. TaxID=2834404 RepID=UPI0030FA0D52
MKKITLLVTLLFSLFMTENLFAQKMLRETSLQQQIDKSSLVVEGKVIAKKSFWNTDNGLIYTKNTVEVYKVFKGEPTTIVDVITLGGTVGLKNLTVNPSLKLYKGDVGVFTLQKSNVSAYLKKDKLAKKEFRPYGSSQGFYRYNLYDNIAANPFSKKKGISNSFYDEIMNYTKSSYIEVSEFKTNDYSKSNQSKNSFVPSSITFPLTAVTAGTKEVLTISGSGFGGVKGKVGFSNANDGGATYVDALDSQVLTWSDTQITVEVPSAAGTGKIQVTDGITPIPGVAVSSANLTVLYSESNVEGDYGEGELAYQVQHYNQNGAGGYTWEMQTDFFNDTEHPGAKAAFERAFNNWVCETGVNWVISDTATIVDIIGNDTMADGNMDGEPDEGDGTNVIRFDNGTELEDITMNDDILGACFSWYSGCGPSPFKWYVSELDIVFDSDINDPITPAMESWYFGSDPLGIAFEQWDFESVALHELGHGHQLDHIIDNSTPVNNGNDVMNYTLQNFEYQRVIGANNSTAANNIQGRSEGAMVCSLALMTNASCPLSVNENELTEAIKIYPNPAKDQFYINNASYINLQK